MRLSNMKRFSDTVRKGEWTSPVADSMVALWGGEPGKCWCWRSSANHVFKALVNGKTHWLRFNADDERRLGDVESEIAVVRWFADQGMRVSEPVASVNGRFVETVETGAGTFHTVLFTDVEGEARDSDDMDAEGHAEWGKALGRYHALSRRMPKALSGGRPDWRDHMGFIMEYIPTGDAELSAVFRELTDWCNGLASDDDFFGLIHYDFDSDNLAWRDGDVGVLDFDDSARYWYAADIANTLASLSDDDPKALAFLVGYSSEAPVPSGYREQALNLKRLQALYKYARVARSVDTDDTSLLAYGGRSLREVLLEGMERNRRFAVTGIRG